MACLNKWWLFTLRLKCLPFHTEEQQFGLSWVPAALRVSHIWYREKLHGEWAAVKPSRWPRGLSERYCRGATYVFLPIHTFGFPCAWIVNAYFKIKRRYRTFEKPEIFILSSAHSAHFNGADCWTEYSSQVLASNIKWLILKWVYFYTSSQCHSLAFRRNVQAFGLQPLEVGHLSTARL